MMMDGVPGVRAAEGVRSLSLCGRSTPQRGGGGRRRGANDLEAGEDPPHTRSAGDEAKDVVVQVICCLP